MKIEGSKSVIKSEHCISTKIDNNTVILNLETGKYIKLNQSASIIWEKIETCTSIDHLKKLVSTESGVSLKDIGTDIESFLLKAEVKKMIKIK
tara:strand:- start:133 stop:411 length:279 start_codon:yes stop_codon:yes gene_type:complete